MSALLAERQKKMYQRGEIICRKCAAPIYVYKFSALPDEFSVRCPRCGDRGMHLKRAITIHEVRGGRLFEHLPLEARMGRRLDRR
jgi:ribosomal protein L37E